MDRADGLANLAAVRRVLLIEDDRELRTLLARFLTGEGYHVDAVADGQSGLHRALVDEYDVMVIDKGLPAIDGVELTARLRSQGIPTPIMILTAYSTVADRVAGLDAGAEDYLAKPFDIDELAARVRALIRRHTVANSVIRIGMVAVDVPGRVARRSDGTEIELSGRECALLRVLAARPARVFSRDELRTQVFAHAESESIVDTYVHYIRRKLGKTVIRTVRGQGYRIGTM